MQFRTPRLFAPLACAILILAAVGCASQQEPAAPVATDQTAPAAQPAAMETTPPPATQSEAAPVQQTSSAITPNRPEPRHFPRTSDREAAQAPAAQQVAQQQPAKPAEPVIKTLASGTPIDLAFVDPVSSASNQAGDGFRARISKDVVQDGVVVIPAGSIVTGSVTEAVGLKKIGGTAKLSLEFTKVELASGGTAAIHAAMTQVGKSETKKDAATIAGATAGGAILGRLMKKGDKGKGTAIGAIVGAATGTAIAAKTQGQEIEFPAGTEISVQLDQPAQVPLRE